VAICGIYTLGEARNLLWVESMLCRVYQAVMRRRNIPFILLALIPASGAFAQESHDALVSKHAAANAVPESLVRRVIRIESRGNPRLVSKGNYGLMQIRLGTARALGYTGTAEGLLDPDTNMTFAVKYLAGAYRVAGCDEKRAIAYYQRGYHRKPKSRCHLPQPARFELAGVSGGTSGSGRTLEKVEAARSTAPNSMKSASGLDVTHSANTSNSEGARMVAISRSELNPTPTRPAVSSEAIAGAPPLPRARQPLARDTNRQKTEPTRSALHKKTRAKKDAGSPLDLLSYLKKLITPDTRKVPARKRRPRAQL
jgi:hypothetical protein